MKLLNFEGRRVVAIEGDDFTMLPSPGDGRIDVLLVPKERMQTFRGTDLFQSLWAYITDATRIVYC